MANDRRLAVKRLKSFYLSPKIDINDFRAKINENFSEVFLPNNVDLEEKVLRGTKYDIISPEMFASNRVLLYIHGGSFVGGSRESYRAFVSALANATASKAYVPEFRLAPAHPFPAGLEDVQILFNAIYAETEATLSIMTNSTDFSKKPEFIIMADSSGASIALALLYGLEQKYRECVKQVVLFSPWLDFYEENPIFKSKKVSDEVFTADSIRLSAEHYTYQENWKNPLVSPLQVASETLQNFPPVYIQSGENEIYAKDSLTFQELLKAAGSKCEIDVWPKMPPLFQLVDENLSESHLAVEKIGRLITAKDYSCESVREIQLELERN